MPSPVCEVKVGAGSYVSTEYGVDITPGAVITIRLADQTDVEAWTVYCLTTDELSDKDAINAALVVNATTRTATFTAPADSGRTYRFISRVNNGRDANNVERASYTTTFCLYAPTAGGLRCLAVDEQLEGDPDFGWIASYNAGLRNPPSGEVNTASNVGSGAGVFKDKLVADLRFRSIVGGTNVSATQNVNDVTIGITGVIGTANGGTGNAALSFPAGAETVVGRATEDTLTNKTIGDGLKLGTTGPHPTTGFFRLAYNAGASVPVFNVFDSVGTLRNFLSFGPGDQWTLGNTAQDLNVNAFSFQLVALNGAANFLGHNFTFYNYARAAYDLRTNATGAVFSTRMGGKAADRTTIGHRLTLASNTPITTSDVTSASTIYLTQYHSNVIALYYSGEWYEFEVDEASLALTDLTASRNYDVFAYFDGTSVKLELSSAWASDTARTDALARQNGVLVKSGDATRRYVGTIRTTSTTTTEDSVLKRFVWNLHNRVERPLMRREAADTWSYSGTTWRQAAGSTSNCVEIVSGEAPFVDLSVHTLVSGGGGQASVGIGIDSTTVNSAHVYGGVVNATLYSYSRCEYRGYVTAGYHKLNWLEITGGTAATFHGDVGNPTLFSFGMLGRIEA